MLKKLKNISIKMNELEAVLIHLGWLAEGAEVQDISVSGHTWSEADPKRLVISATSDGYYDEKSGSTSFESSEISGPLTGFTGGKGAFGDTDQAGSVNRLIVPKVSEQNKKELNELQEQYGIKNLSV